MKYGHFSSKGGLVYKLIHYPMKRLSCRRRKAIIPVQKKMNYIMINEIPVPKTEHFHSYNK